MYASCSVNKCDKKSKYLIDIQKQNGYKTHTRCQDHTEFKQNITCKKDIHNLIIPLSEKGSGTDFISNCSYCSGNRASEIIRFIDSLDVTTTESRCKECVEKLVKSPRDIVSRHPVSDVNIRADDCS
jgi:hypothetical protein